MTEAEMTEFQKHLLGWAVTIVLIVVLAWAVGR
jgi:hypothetical protein